MIPFRIGEMLFARKCRDGEEIMLEARMKQLGDEIPRLQGLMHYVAREGFEHHVAVSLDRVARAVHEALTNYLGWDVHLHA